MGMSSSNLNDIHKTVKIPRSVRRTGDGGMGKTPAEKNIDDIMNN